LVVGYDESPPSRDAVAFAAGVARRNKAWMIVAFIANVPTAAAMAPMTVPLIAEEAHADAIVVGRSASRRHAYAGSVTTRLIRHARRPILVVP
jgi:hypothetical protein